MRTAIRIASVTPATRQPSEEDKATLFYDDFREPPGRRYFEYAPQNGSFVWDVKGGMGGGGAMRGQFERGQVSAGSLKVLFGKNPFAGRGIRPRETFREIYWRVYVKHDEGWQGNPGKLARATCLAGTDWSQGLIAHVWGGRGDALCIDPATGITDGKKVTTRYNDFPRLRWLGLKHGQTPLFRPEESGRWVCVESHIRLNTPGRRDGALGLWVDGRREAWRDDLDWHGAWGDYAINAVFLENYWNTGSVRRQARWFDAFVISARPIGPITAPANPTVARTPRAAAAWQVQATTDPDGGAAVWTSDEIAGAKTTATLDGIAGGAYWLRVRERGGSGDWASWTAWHAPFRTSA